MPMPAPDATQEIDTSLVAAIGAFADAAARLAERLRAVTPARIASADRLDLAFECLGQLEMLCLPLAVALNRPAEGVDPAHYDDVVAKGVALILAIAVRMAADLGFTESLTPAVIHAFEGHPIVADAPAERIEVVVADQAAS